jgi:hypothetical protein
MSRVGPARRTAICATILAAAFATGEAATLGCRSSRFTPGNASMGTYGFRAERLELACALAEVTEESAEFEFEATFSETAETSEAWVTMNSGLSTAPRPGSWDGQYFRSTAEAPRVFPSQCSDCQMALEETIAVALLSRSQSEASGNQCPEAPLDGGLPAEDAGALPPRQRPLGFDGVRACGELWTSVRGALKVDGGACAEACSGCRAHYRLVGARR